MVIINELKHNRFRKVSIPAPNVLVAQFGLTRPGKSYSGDEYVAPSLSKIDSVKTVNDIGFSDPE